MEEFLAIKFIRIGPAALVSNGQKVNEFDVNSVHDLLICMLALLYVETSLQNVYFKMQALGNNEIHYLTNELNIIRLL